MSGYPRDRLSGELLLGDSDLLKNPFSRDQLRKKLNNVLTSLHSVLILRSHEPGCFTKIIPVAGVQFLSGVCDDVLTKVFPMVRQSFKNVPRHTGPQRLTIPGCPVFNIGNGSNLVRQVRCAAMPCPDISDQNTACRRWAHG